VHQTAHSKVKKERLEARLTPEQKAHIERAAGIKGTSVSDFVILSADEAAIRTIREHESIQLSASASAVFAHTLLNPLAPHARLVRAAKRYRKSMSL
jgi:uncharacterized protein (DUF1778 family)